MKALLFISMFCLAVIINASGQTPQEMLNKAIYEEEVNGNLEEAIILFHEIVDDKSTKRTVAAEAYYHLGLSNEKLGNKKAKEYYKTIVNSYGDQTEFVRVAKERLSKLLVAEKVSETPLQPKFTKIKIPTQLSPVSLSPDGKDLALVSEKKMWKMPLSGNLGPDIPGTPVQLNTGDVEVQWAWLDWSRDCKWIAFNGFPKIDGKEGGSVNNQSIYSIYIMPSGGGTPNKIIENYRSYKVSNYRISLSPDGKNLAFSSIEENKQHIFSTSVDNVIPKQLTEMEAREPVFSPDGKYIAFVKDKNAGNGEGDLGLWIIPSAGGSPQLLADAGKASSPIWSPDGKMIAFLDFSQGKLINIIPVSINGKSTGKVIRIDAPKGTEDVKLLAGWTLDNKIGVLLISKLEFGLYTLPVKGAQAAMILNDTPAFQPRWSHDGKQIFYVTEPEDGINRSKRMFLASVSAIGGKGTPLQTNIDGKSVRQFGYQSGNRVSPDGKWIVTSTWTSVDTNTVNVHWPTSKIWKIAVDGNDAIQITNTIGNYADQSPCWSPDGEKVAFVRFQMEEGKDNIFGCSPKIYSINSVGGEPELLMSISGKYVNSLIWSPNGKMIAYLTKEIEEPHTENLNLYEVEKKESRTIGDIPSANDLSEIAWSPDSKRIALNDEDGKVIKIITLADESIEDINTGLVGVNIHHLDWSPDGERFVFGGIKGGGVEFWFLEDFLPKEGTGDKQK